jgi:cation diffusion facilitator CzcD-associated flavoprotein CzcO
MADARETTSQPQYEAIVIGAGVCGIYMLHRLLEQGVNATVLETGDGPGGTWYWNRYPGARFDSESYTYGYSFSEKLLQEWNWSEHFAAQPETRKYLEHVVEELGLEPHMRFGVTVKAATFDEQARAWTVALDNGETLTTRLLLTAIGMLSAATMPRIEGVERFEGESFHTYYAPQGVNVDGKRVAVIGTGATGVQVIAEIADKVAELTVFQRRPNWCAPLHNGPIDEEEMAKIKASYDEIFARCKETPGSFIHGPDRREFFELSKEERRAFWEQLYQARGFSKWLGNFREVFMDARANAEYSAFMAEKIRERVHDPEIAEKLIPKDHGFGTRRVPLETHYYEAYNRDNVHLVDVNETPIERVTPKGVKTSAREYAFDVIIYATGFDAITGAFDRIDITGANGEKLRDKWRDGPETYLGLGVHGFPNFIILAGPQSGSVASNFPRGIEEAVDWATDLIRYLREHGYSRVEPEADAEKEWVEHVKSFYEGNMIAETKSWFTGYNSNVDGHDKLRYMVYFGGAPAFRERLAEVAEHGYEGFELS